MAPTMPTVPGVSHRQAQVGEVTLHLAEAGPADGPLVLLLHGFPEFWYSWRYQIPALASAGFHVVAPDLRGYNLSEKPRGIASYDVDKLAGDVANLIDLFGVSKAHVVGHDWGANIAWIFAMLHPEKLDRLGILNVPHPVRFTQGLRSWRQLRKSWYVFFFQLPWLPELGWRLGNYRQLRQVLRSDPVRKGAISDADIEHYVTAMSQPGALTASINYYRAIMQRGAGVLKKRATPIQAHVLIIWGEHDRYLGVELAEPSNRWVKNYRLEKISDASHWVQVDRPERVNELLIPFLLGQDNS